MAAKIVVPVRYAAWLAGDLGRALEARLKSAVAADYDWPNLAISRLPRAFLLETSADQTGAFLEAVATAAQTLETETAAVYPVFHHEMGPVWTGTLQAIFEPLAVA